MILYIYCITKNGLSVTMLIQLVLQKIPDGSNITGKFNIPLNVLESNDDDINVTLSFNNNSFEWVRFVPDGKYENLWLVKKYLWD